MDSPLIHLAMTAAALYVAWLWYGDLKAARAGTPNEKGFPGASEAPARAFILAITGALVLLGLETFGEIVLGIADEQSEMKLSLAVYSILGAPIIEELILRGYLFFDKKGDRVFWTSALACSVVFALLHPHLWQWHDAEALKETPLAAEAMAFKFGDAALELDFGVKAWFSTSVLFTFSLWLYATRYLSWNTHRSLAVPVAAHAAKNLGVVAVKGAQGFLVVG